jgi:hypothetical protein
MGYNRALEGWTRYLLGRVNLVELHGQVGVSHGKKDWERKEVPVPKLRFKYQQALYLH